MDPELKRLERAYRRALTIHNREQYRGQFSLSVWQTRRMYLAVESLQRAYGKLERYRRSLAMVAR